MVFSGSVVVDEGNTSGLGTAASPPLVAVYTRYDKATRVQSQALAYSTDAGRTWTKYAGNPVLDIGSTEFRDPKVFWYEPDRRWIMAVALPVEHKIAFYGSGDLKRWEHLSDFGPANAVGGVWEVPDLFELPVDGDPDRTKWVLVVNLNPGSVAGGSGAQYFLGDFDGVRFRADDGGSTSGDVLADFESGTYGAWSVTGAAFGNGPATGTLAGQNPVSGFAGDRLVNSFRGGDAAQGTLTSPAFTLDRDYVNLLVGGGAHRQAAAATVFADFEGTGWPSGWSATGSFADQGPAAGTLPGQMPVFGYTGSRLVNTFVGFDAGTGTITSPEFEVAGDYINLQVGGGSHADTAVTLVVDGSVVRRASGLDSESLRWVSWDVSDLAGRTAVIRIVDGNQGSWGHVLVDQIEFAPGPAGTGETGAGATAVNLLVDGEVVRTASGRNSEQLEWVSWDVSPLRGRQARIEIVDRNSGGWGHVLADEITLADAPALGADDRIGWLDYGRDFYAALSWTGEPDGRRTILGWMSNWEYATTIPTSPWRGAMSLPRALSLETVGGRVRLVQRPVDGLRALRDGPAYHLADTVVDGSRPLADPAARGKALEVVAEIDVQDADTAGLKVRVGGGEETVIGYDARSGELYVDRSRAGQAGFSPGFAGRQRAPLAAPGGKVRLHAFVDWSSVEVFGGRGETVITDRVFPDGGSVDVEAFSTGGAVTLESLDVWRLRSAHRDPDGEPGEDPAPSAPANPGFESGDLTGWTTTGTAFSAAVTSETRWDWGCCFGQDGDYHAWGFRGGRDEATGTLTSSAFELGGTGEVSLLVGGGDDAQRTYVALVRAADGAELARSTGTDSEEYRRVVWDASAHLGERVHVKAVDTATGGWGHINLDDVRVHTDAGAPALIAHWPFAEGAGTAVEDAVSGMRDPVEYVFNRPAFKPRSDPLWQPRQSGAGILSGALLFDGYSTWLSRPGDRIQTPRDALTVEAWVAPRAFEWGDEGKPSAIVNQHDRGANQGYLLGVGRHGSLTFQAGVEGGWQALNAPGAAALERGRWAYVVATFDAAGHRMRLYRNGDLVAERDTPAGGRLTPFAGDLLIGRHNQPAILNDTFALNMFSGLIDEVKIRSRALSAAEVAGAYQTALDSFADRHVPVPDLAMKRSRFDGDVHRPQYHFMAPGHWMNEPNAPMQFNGRYHIFYQHNQHGPYWHNMSWGHAVSDDLAHWRDLPVALVPEANSVAPDGVWSGSASRDGDGNPLLFFTAGDDSVSPNQRTGLARSASWPGDLDLERWTMDAAPVTVQSAGLDVGAGRKVRMGDFRDPYVWREGDTWFQLVGSGVQTTGGGDVGGTALLYTSKDQVHWSYAGPLLVGDIARYPATGQVWELPVFLPLGTDGGGNAKRVLIVNPMWHDASEYNTRYVWYWVGTWDAGRRRFTPDHAEPRVFDYGEHFTGPSGTVDERGRSLVFSIAQDRRTERAHYDAGWAHNAGLPLVLSRRGDGDLGVKPVPELAALHTTTDPLRSIVSDTSVDAANAAVSDVQGDMLHVQLELARGSATRYGIKVRRTPDGAEETLLSYDAARGTISVDRSRSGSQSALRPDLGTQGGPLPLGGANLKLDVFVDRSMIEAYANGHKAITTRAYPTRRDATGIRLWADGGAVVKSMKVWKMDSAYAP